MLKQAGIASFFAKALPKENAPTQAEPPPTRDAQAAGGSSHSAPSAVIQDPATQLSATSTSSLPRPAAMRTKPTADAAFNSPAALVGQTKSAVAASTASSSDVKRPRSPSTTPADAKRPCPMPTLAPVLAQLPTSARTATVHIWQFLRCMAGELTVEDGEPLLPLSLDDLEAALACSVSSPSVGGPLGDVHRALLRAILPCEDERIDTVDDEEIILPALRMRAASGGISPEPRALPPEAVVRFKDASALIDEISWPEILRRLVLYLDAVEMEPVEPPLTQLAIHLGTHEYASASIELKALALAALCDRLVCGEAWSLLLDGKHEEVEQTAKELGKEEAVRKREGKAAERAEKAAAKALKEEHVGTHRPTLAAPHFLHSARFAVCSLCCRLSERSALLSRATIGGAAAGGRPGQVGDVAGIRACRGDVGVAARGAIARHAHGSGREVCMHVCTRLSRCCGRRLSSPLKVDRLV